MSLLVYLPFDDNKILNYGALGCVQPNMISGPEPSIADGHGGVGNSFLFNNAFISINNITTIDEKATIAYWSKTSTNAKMAWTLTCDAHNYLNLFESTIYTLNTGDSNNNPFKTPSNTNISVLHDGNWHHFAITFNGTVCKLYIDGQYQGTALTYKEPTTINVDGILRVGGGFNGAHSYDWNGYIDDFRLYDDCLTDDDILNLYTDENKNPKGLRVWMPLNAAHKFNGIGLQDPALCPINCDEGSGGIDFIDDRTIGVKSISDFSEYGHIRIPMSEFTGYTQMSVCFFARFKEITLAPAYETVFGLYRTNVSWGGNIFSFLRNNQTNKFVFCISNGTNYTGTNCTTGDLESGRWYHFACVYRNDGAIYLYQNGELTNTYQTSIVPAFSSINKDFFIGRAIDTYKFKGNLLDFRIYNVGLSDDEVKKLYRLKLFELIGKQINVVTQGEQEKGFYLDNSGLMNLGCMVSSSITYNYHKIKFDGTNSQIRPRQDENQKGFEFSGGTISLWFRPTSKPNVNRLVYTDERSHMAIGFSSTGNSLIVRCGTSNGSTTAYKTTGITWGALNHVIVAYGTNTLPVRCYINGVQGEQYTTSTGFSETAGAGVTIGGRQYNTTSRFDGSIDKLTVYSVSLSSDEMLKIYNEGTQYDYTTIYPIVS